MVTPAQVKVLQDTWGQVKEKVELDEMGRLVFIRLFTVNPQLLPYFKFAAECDTIEKLKTSSGLAEHGANVCRALDDAISILDDIPTVVDTLTDLGKLHRTYNIKKEYLPMATGAILHTLQQGLGDEWTPEVSETWKALMDVISDIIGKELEE